MNLPRPANSDLFPRPPTLALAEPLPLLRATLWADGEWRAHGGQRLVARCGDLVARGHRVVGDLCMLLDDAGHGACGLRVVWWDLQPAETVPSVARAAADVRREQGL